MSEISGAAYLNGEFLLGRRGEGFDLRQRVHRRGGGLRHPGLLEGGLFKLPPHRARFERSAHAAMIPLALSVAPSWRRSSSRRPAASGLATMPTCRRSRPAACGRRHRMAVGRADVHRLRHPVRLALAEGEGATAASASWCRRSGSGRRQRSMPRSRISIGCTRTWPESRRIGQGADDVVLLDDRGLLTESRGSNVFVSAAETLHTAVRHPGRDHPAKRSSRSPRNSAFRPPSAT